MSLQICLTVLLQLLDSYSLVLYRSLFTNYSGKKRHAEKSGSS